MKILNNIIKVIFLLPLLLLFAMIISSKFYSSSDTEIIFLLFSLSLFIGYLNVVLILMLLIFRKIRSSLLLPFLVSIAVVAIYWIDPFSYLSTLID